MIAHVTAWTSVNNSNIEEIVMTTRKYKISGMSCSHCERAVRDEVSEIPGVHVDEVSAETGMLIVSSDDDIKDMKVLEAVEEAGYSGTRL